MLLIEFVIPNLSQISFVYQKSLKWTFKTGFWVLNHLNNLCSCVLNSLRLFCSKKLVCIKAFWYTNNIVVDCVHWFECAQVHQSKRPTFVKHEFNLKLSWVSSALVYIRVHQNTKIVKNWQMTLHFYVWSSI